MGGADGTFLAFREVSKKSALQADKNERHAERTVNVVLEYT
jgi:hypothetical protein